MPQLNTSSKVSAPDDLYQLLIDIHAGRSDAESMKLNAKLILLLVNHIGDPEVVLEAISIASSKADTLE